MSGYDERAERAFRAALTDRAERFEPAPLVPPTARRRRWLPALAAAAAVLLVVTGGALLGRRALDESPRRTPAATTTSPATSAGLPDGWRWESFRDVMVGVPDTWGYGQAPASDWCAAYDARGNPTLPQGRPASPTPFVDTRNGHESVLSIGCMGPYPEALARVHLSFASQPGMQPLLPPTGGWHNLTRSVGAAQVTVTTDAAHRDLARRILATAHVVERDQYGCPATSPIQQGHFARPATPFDVAALRGVSAVTICQYELAHPQTPGLLASRQLTGTAATDLLAQLQAAPVGGGPDEPSTCLATMWGDVGEQLQFSTAQGLEVGYAYHDWCFGNGFDDGTHRRTLTRSWCPLLFGDRVVINGGSTGVYARCSPHG